MANDNETLQDIADDLLDKNLHRFWPKSQSEMSVFLTGVINRLRRLDDRMKEQRLGAAKQAAEREAQLRAARERNKMMKKQFYDPFR